MFTNVTLIFFLLLVPLSGFIAWAGDRIGHRTGKKRHTLWGLRPRHTAMLFTVGTGIGIAAISFSLFYASSERFRVLISEGETLVQKNRDLKQDNARQNMLIAASERRVRESVYHADQAEQEQATADRERMAAEKARDTAKAGQQLAEQQAKNARTELNEATTKLLAARADLSQAQHSLTSVQFALADKTQRLHNAENRVHVAEGKVAQAKKRVTTAEANAKSAERRTRDVAARADATLREQRHILDGRLTAQKADFDRQISGQQQLFIAQSQKTAEQKRALDSVTTELAQKRADLQEVANTTAALQATTAALRGKQITYRLGEEVDRISIPAGRSIWRIQNGLEAFLSTAAKKAESRGAGHKAEERAVFILPRPISLPRSAASLTTGGVRNSGGGASVNINAVAAAANGGTALSPDVTFLTEEDIVRTVAGAIRTSNEDVVVIAAAAANAVSGEPVAVELKTYKNPLLFQENDKIAEGGIDGSASRQSVADALYVFLRKDVRGKLLDAGIIPQSRGSDPAQTTADATATVVNLSGDEWLHLMEDVRQAGARARITVRAARALRAGDSVALRFEVRGGNGGGAMTQTSGVESTR